MMNRDKLTRWGIALGAIVIMLAMIAIGVVVSGPY